MINVEKLGVMLEKTVRPFENEGVLNPTCIEKDGVMHMFYRAVQDGNFSSIGHCIIERDRVLSRDEKPILISEHDYERHGVEDPRIVEVEGVYYLFYTAYDGINARVAFASSEDLIHFTKQGLMSSSLLYSEVQKLFSTSLSKSYTEFAEMYRVGISPDLLLWDKDVVLFPEKINGKFLLFHRVLPGIQSVSIDSFDRLTPPFWKEYFSKLDEHIVMDPKLDFETHVIGSGAIPVKTSYGWIMIYHGVESGPHGKTYHAAAALLDLHNPTKVIGRLPYPLFSPEYVWEKRGVVHNVVFPTGTALYSDELYIYYGAADERIGVARVSLQELIRDLQKYPA